MAGGLVGLLDDVAALAKLAAASIDDVGLAATKASAKAAGLVVDDAAVTPAYVQGLAADRELPIIKKIAIGSIKNKLIFILPVVLLLSEFVPLLVDIILMFGGAYLSYEGAHKIIHKLQGHKDTDHDVPVALKGEEAEEKTISGAIRTDFILSSEIMVIALKEVLEGNPDAGVITRGAILVVVALLITTVVYGAVGLIVKMDDVGLALTKRDEEGAQNFGRLLVNGMPTLLKWLTIIGTAAMLWVGGHIILAGSHELGWDGLYDPVIAAEDAAHGVGGIGGVLGWLVNTGLSALIGFIIGAIIFFAISKFKGGGEGAHHGEEHGAAAAH